MTAACHNGDDNNDLTIVKQNLLRNMPNKEKVVPNNKTIMPNNSETIPRLFLTTDPSQKMAQNRKSDT